MLPWQISEIKFKVFYILFQLKFKVKVVLHHSNANSHENNKKNKSIIPKIGLIFFMQGCYFSITEILISFLFFLFFTFSFKLHFTNCFDVCITFAICLYRIY